LATKQSTDTEVPPELCALPAGRHSLPREFVAQNQRTRLIAGMIEVAGEQGYARASVSRCIEAAHVSRKTFYEQFADKEECFTAAYEAGMAEVRSRFAAPFESDEGRPQTIEAALAAVLEFFAENPNVARVTMVEVLLSTPRLFERHHAEIVGLAPLLSRDRDADGNGSTPSPLTEEGIISGVFSLISQRILTGETATLPRMLPQLTELALTPYQGAARLRQAAS